MLKSTDELLLILDSYRPLPVETINSIEEDFAIKYNHESNRIEGNTLTLVETRVFLESGITLNGKPFKDFLDVINHKHAIDYMMDMVLQKQPLTEKIIKELNSIILKSTSYENRSGSYRNVPVAIAGSPHLPPQPYLIAPSIEQLLIDYHDSQAHIIEKVAIFHAKFEAIHPFVEGNGRVGRLVMNLELLKAGYPLLIIKSDEKADYYNALIAADGGGFEEIIKLVNKGVAESIEYILKIIDPNWQLN